MEINANFSERIVIHSDEIDWVDSPMQGVQRKMLDRIGDEVARATSIVRYAPGSSFSPHTHTGGEEFFVLDGVFQDEHGDYPVGAYVRNPPQSQHTPSSKPGCIIFVKLWQFDLDDRTHVNTMMDSPGSTLFEDTRESVRMEQWDPGAEVSINTKGGAELFVLDGGFEQGNDHFRQYSWLRQPDGANVKIKAGKDGAKVWIKTGHLGFAKAPALTTPA